ncbi:MAG: FAD-dependent oxidoreductase [Desulfobacteraceae bacterium]|nr:FAD-dependent oxidoreductase [Desulfobacteraceae bacterium]
MSRLKVEDLYRIKGDTIRDMLLDAERKSIRITVHMGTCGISSGAEKIRTRFIKALEKSQRKDIVITTSGCAGMCNREPMVTIERFGEEPIRYADVTEERADAIFEQHVLKGQITAEWVYARGWEQHEKDFEGPQGAVAVVTHHIRQLPFFGMQNLRVMRNRGLTQAESIEEYISRDGYFGAAKAIFQLKPEEIIAEVKISGIRGRGGGGFPTGLKWEFASKSPGDTKYVLCNADEGDPGAFMDRCVLESDPHSVLEGMIIAAKAIGSRQGYIYCRAEYPLAVKMLNHAIGQAREYGLLGENILGSGFNFDVEVYRGAGAFVCGEETALMTSIEGKRGTPRPRPPFPAIQGLWKKPTILNNVETFANIPQIIFQGGKWYAGVGTTRSKGTKVFALTGDVKNVGLVEVPMGISLGSIIYDVGGGIPKDKKFKAVQLGGPSGGCIPGAHLNASVDYETIIKLGAIVGSGGMIVMDEDKCVVDVARFFMEFCRDESCGKCTPCRVGTQKMLEILTRICEGKGTKEDIPALERLADYMKNNALCGLGQTAPNPVLSTLRYFRQEYEQHIDEKRCPAVVCNAFFQSPCQHACPVGMDIPAYISLIKANRLTDAYKVLLKTNPFPGICGRVCDHKCELKCRRSTLDEPVHIKYLKRYITDQAPAPVIARAEVTRKEKIAVIGAGPAGLTAARDLTLRGYHATVFEELPEAGGMLRWGIPAYRLPRNVLKREIQDILDLGVELRCNVRVGRDISWDTLRSTYEAIFVAIGAQRSMQAELEGKGYRGITGAVEFLRELHLGGHPHVGRKVAVIGGGNSAIDAAQCALRLGAEDVTIYYRRTKADMPALKEEVATAQKEGVKIEELVAPIRFIGREDNVCQMVLQKMRLGEFDAGGRKKPAPILGSEYTVDADQVILAIGQEVDGAFEFKRTGIAVTANRLVEVVPGKKTQTTAPMIFAGGDVVTGPDTVVGAIAAGHRAAQEIDAAIRARNEEGPYVPAVEEEVAIPQEIEEEIREMMRTHMPEADIRERVRDFREVELGFEKAVALQEAGRCLRCDVQSS